MIEILIGKIYKKNSTRENFRSYYMLWLCHRRRPKTFWFKTIYCNLSISVWISMEFKHTVPCHNSTVGFDLRVIVVAVL